MITFEDRLKLLQPAPASDALRKRLAHPSTVQRRKEVLKFVPLSVAAAGLLAIIIYTILASLPARPETPQEAFRKIEGRLERAKSLRVRFTREAFIRNPTTEKVITSGTMLLTEGNKLSFVLKERRAADRPNPLDVEFVFISDGTRLKTYVRTKDGLKETPQGKFETEGLTRKFALAMARNSIATPNTILGSSQEDLEKSSQVAELASDDQEMGLRTLTYRSGPFQVKLWYDPKTHSPIKRVLTNDQLGTFTENYEECVVGEVFPANAFRFPSEN